MRLRYFWIANTICMVAAAGIAIAHYFERIDERNALISIGIFLGPMLITSYHFGFVMPHYRDALQANITLSMAHKELLRIHRERGEEIARNQKLLRSLTTTTRNKVRKEITGRFIYFIGDAERNAIKIGISHDPDKRLSDLQVAHAGTLKILTTVVGTEADERALHQRFAKSRLNGEWFRATPEILTFIDAMENPKKGNGHHG